MKSLAQYFKANIIEKKMNGHIVSICDWFNTVIGHQFAASSTVLNQQISDAVTALFEKTTVNVYVYQSNTIDALTFPGMNKTSSPIIQRISIFSKHIPFFGPIILAITQILTLHEVFTGIAENEPMLIYNEATGKLKMKLKQVTCYLSSGLVEILEDDEIIASVLHEVGHNTMILFNVISTIAGGALGGAFLSFFSRFKDSSTDGTIEQASVFSSVATLGLMVLAFQIIVAYMNRRQEIKSDMFAIKCGYGEAMARAIEKVYNVKTNKETFQNTIKDTNFLDKILHYVIKIITIIYNFFSKFRVTGYQDIKNRIATIKHNTEVFNSNMANQSDRTNDLD